MGILFMVQDIVKVIRYNQINDKNMLDYHAEAKIYAACNACSFYFQIRGNMTSQQYEDIRFIELRIFRFDSFKGYIHIHIHMSSVKCLKGK